MENAYAEALWKMIESGLPPHAAVDRLKKALEAKGRATLLPRIGRAFDRLAARRLRKSTMSLTVARRKDFEDALQDAKKILIEQGIEETDLIQSVDETLIGGWRLEGRGILLERSWKNSLLSIYNRATNT